MSERGCGLRKERPGRREGRGKKMERWEEGREREGNMERVSRESEIFAANV